MAGTVQPSWLVIFLIFLLYGLPGEPKDNAKLTQSRMMSDNGHLVFTTGDNKEIRFEPSSSGRIKVGTEDLTQLLSQIKANKEDIDDIKSHGGAIPPEITNNLNQLNTKVSTLGSQVTDLEQTFHRVSCSSNPCQNGGTCLNLLNSYYCLCPSNWAGPNCSSDVNECQVFSGTLQGCQNGATCINNPGSFTGVPRTELAYFISLQNFLKLGVAPLMLPQQMMAEEITLSTTDLQKICSILLQTLKDLNFFKKAASSFSDLFEDKHVKAEDLRCDREALGQRRVGCVFGCGQGRRMQSLFLN
ncbi:hypothetical protein ILYODFUR_026583 [Ilyodon furcidens]|uniref:EGF-like domain-containing protein n=1 Tax=Ilyodon furcidens TaxID=33524 RepID=A0ABV0SPS3_9TELE